MMYKPILFKVFLNLFSLQKYSFSLYEIILFNFLFMISIYLKFITSFIYFIEFLSYLSIIEIIKLMVNIILFINYVIF